MNAIVGLAEVLGETPLTNEQRRYVNTMFANGKSLLELINNILDLAKIESGRLTTVEEEFDVAELSESVAESLALRAHSIATEIARELRGRNGLGGFHIARFHSQYT